MRDFRRRQLRRQLRRHAQRADYDPQAAALSSAYVTAFNAYVRKELRYGEGKAFRPSVQLFRTWNFSHQLPAQTQAFPARQGTNVMPDLGNATEPAGQHRVLLLQTSSAARAAARSEVRPPA